MEANGTIGKEEIWVDYYVTKGSIASGAIALYEPALGAESHTGDVLTVPSRGEETLWAVVHDDRGGVSWVSAPIHAR